jgi:hypothetical protein
MALLLRFVVLVGLLSLKASCSAARDTVSPGNGLSGSSSRLVSNNSKFTLGFFKPNITPFHHTTSNPNTYLGIWYSKVPKLTPLWSANGDSPVVDPAIPELAISGDGNLVILDQTTNSVIWSTRANPTTNATVAVLLNDGNLVLRSSANSSAVFWQSFDYPTDTFFAGAKIGWDKATGLNRRLVSRKSLVDQGPGLYTLGFDRDDGVGRLVWNSTVEIVSTGTWNGQYFSLAPEMIGPVLPAFTFVSNDQEVYLTYTLRDDKAMALTQLGVNGQAFVGVWMDELQDWLVHYRQPCAPVRHLRDVWAFHGLRRGRRPDLRLHEGFLCQLARGLGARGQERRVRQEHSVRRRLWKRRRRQQDGGGSHG